MPRIEQEWLFPKEEPAEKIKEKSPEDIISEEELAHIEKLVDEHEEQKKEKPLTLEEQEADAAWDRNDSNPNYGYVPKR